MLFRSWLPLVLLTLLDAREFRTARHAARLGVTFGICAVANWYYGLFAALVCGSVVLWDAGVALRRRRLAELRVMVAQEVDGPGRALVDHPADRLRIAAVIIGRRDRLVVTGELDAKFTAIGSEMTRAIGSNAHHVVVKGSGHSVPFETPDEFATLVDNFIA